MKRPVDWNKAADGLVPAVVQHAQTGQVLMLGYINNDSLAQSERTGLVTFYSRSRQKLWVKGETSGHHLRFVSAEVDCDGDTILLQAIPTGPVCHTGDATCFGPEAKAPALGFLNQLTGVLDDRFAKPDTDTSYVAKLIARGLDRMIQKVGEEATETVIAAKNPDHEKFVGEAADLLFHLMVLLKAKDSSLAAVSEVLAARHRASTAAGD